jgi:hypothetical protein
MLAEMRHGDLNTAHHAYVVDVDCSVCRWFRLPVGIVLVAEDVAVYFADPCIRDEDVNGAKIFQS